MLNLTKLFFSSTDDTVFSDNIATTEEQRVFLTDCRTKIRDYLKPAIANATVAVLGMARRVEPRFRTQGSWSYKTCIQPAQPHLQEIDIDYGVYLPVDVWQDNGPPAAMAKKYFDLVETLLQVLCLQEGWKLETGTNAKDTCIRIDACEWAHIDIPLYAAPLEEFNNVVERTLVLNKAQHVAVFDQACGSESFMESAKVQVQTWDDLDTIMLATRSGIWMASDPEDVAKWFRDQVARFGDLGNQFLRVCRYAKAWRDFHWKFGGPTSISLMIAIAQSFEGKRGRDDVAFENAASTLATALNEEIRESGIDDAKEDFNRMKPGEREDASSKALALADALKQARGCQEYQKNKAIQIVTAQLGGRIPSSDHLVDNESAIEIVRSTVPTIVPAPRVPNTSAG
ncbi:CBASS cGAMP synthase [Pseudomonas pergaminensis]|uniref:CBASS cGAMP synthase n=1 Tax=Pseudomonas pergaminensis TaxID=2853159 RepID=UPI0034D3E481